MPINIYADEIETPVLLIHGEKAHSRYFSEDVYKKMKGNNKELLIIPGAVHTDLYDHMDVIPFAKIAEFFKTNLKEGNSKETRRRNWTAAGFAWEKYDKTIQL